ncbi:hypothetical protein [Halobacillus yeomjeoni]|uniref:Uncharacterized protein n=1 Tax=Halobacillus yeomjeoni TaxID=311194 RepID=A0A931HX38_9BACI|nr:hypothetical protein [Halobacillus yeomjeoni]MBH0231038.1 hypothetical protein [Halobacillus yeomjeoni]
MSLLKRSIVWLAPLIIILTGVGILFAKNYNEVTEPPSEEWSRPLQIATTPSSKQPSVTETKQDQLSVSYLTETGAAHKTYNEDLRLIDETYYDIPVDKFTRIHIEDNQMVYADYYGLYNGKTNEKIVDITGFYPLKNHVFYRDESAIHKLDMETLKSSPVLKLKDEKASVYFHEMEDQVHLMTEHRKTNEHHITFYSLENAEFTSIDSTTLNLDASEELQELLFSINNDTYSLLISTVQKTNMEGNVRYFYYFDQTAIGKNPELTELNFPDPHGAENLKEISDIELKADSGQTSMLFKAFGATKTQFKAPAQFNIYQATLKNDQVGTVKRLSNTPKHSSSPAWFDEKTITWLDVESGNNPLYLSSGKDHLIQSAPLLTTDYFLQALGKTMGMLTYGLFGVMISVVWFIWPLLFIVILSFTNSRAMDHEHSWVLYAGAAIYIAAAVIFKNQLVTEAALSRAPEYLSFTGSTLTYLFGFALLSFGILKIGAKVRDWSMFIQLTYFIALHVAFMTIFFGPYLI